MNSLGWSRRDPAIPASTSNNTSILGSLQSLNPFGQGGVRLPLYENESVGAPLPARTRREEEEGWFARTYNFYTVAFTCLAWLVLQYANHFQSWSGLE